MKKFLFILVLFSSGVYAQKSIDTETIPSKTGILKDPKVRTYSTEIGRKYNKPAYHNHPDLGILPADAPAGKNLVEDLSKRKTDERYYIDIDESSFFYIQKSSKPINFLKNGNYIAIDPSLKRTYSGIYKAVNQPCPTELNILARKSAIYMGSESFAFNHYSLKVLHNDNSTGYYEANWSDIQVNGNDCYIREVFPGIDMRLKYKEAGVKSEFIIKNNLNVKRLYFIDALQVSESLDVKLDGNLLEDHSKGQLLVYDKKTGDTWAEIAPARTHDNSGSRTSWFNPYSLSGNNLELLCDSNILNAAQTVYPVTVDPLVTAVTGNNGTSYLAGTVISPAFCSNTLLVTFPGGSTPWDASPRWSIYSNWCFGYYTGHGALGDDCWQSEARVSITSTCGGRTPSGTTNWDCSGCNSTGNWNPTIAFGSSGTQSLLQCFTPSCSDQTLSFSINTSRTNCNSYSNYDGCTPPARSYCQTLDNWGITIQGRTLETLGSTTTGNGTVATSLPCTNSYIMDPAANYGVSPYTYSWNTGENGSTKSVTPTVGGLITHIATVTDACNTSRTAAFVVTSACSLPVDFVLFQGTTINGKVLLSWSTASERNNDYFLIEKSNNGQSYEAIGSVVAAGNSSSIANYQFEDTELQKSQTNYYRLKQFDKDGTYIFSKVIAVNSEISEKMLCVPNPVKSELQVILQTTETQGYIIEIYTLQGATVLSQHFAADHSLTLNLSNLASGSYLLRAYDSGKKLIGRKIIIRE